MARNTTPENQRNHILRQMPSVSSVAEEWRRVSSQPVDDHILIATVQEVIAIARASGDPGSVVSRSDILDQVSQRIAHLERSRLQPVINATGVLLHTNLGRAPVSVAAASAMADAAASTVSLELEPETGKRGGRMDEISRLMRALTNAESTLVVNNNAGAILLVLSALARDREVIVSRGQSIEIGGGFRIPDVLKQSGATMIEVGTVNRTYARDYRQAISERTAGLLVAHASNFRVEGFVTSPGIGEITAIARDANLPVIEDQGSGSIISPQTFGLAPERTIEESIAASVAVVTASGDKLLGGPQAGLICGSDELIQAIEAHPLARALRASKVVLAGLAETLRHYVRGEAVTALPLWRMIAADTNDLARRAEVIRDRLQLEEGTVAVVQTDATVGGGSLPGQILPSWGLSFEVDDPDRLARHLRTGAPGVYGRINENRLILDLRSVLPEFDLVLGDAVARALNR